MDILSLSSYYRWQLEKYGDITPDSSDTYLTSGEVTNEGERLGEWMNKQYEMQLLEHENNL